MKAYWLRINLGDHKAGLIAEYDEEWNTWYIDGHKYNLRGSITEGEIVLLLNWAAQNKLTSILEPI